MSGTPSRHEAGHAAPVRETYDEDLRQHVISGRAVERAEARLRRHLAAPDNHGESM